MKKVECHSGYTYADRPIAVTWEAKRLEVSDILAEWRTPMEKHFRVRTLGGQTFELLWSELSDEWQVVEV